MHLYRKQKLKDKTLKQELKTSNERYESIRKQIKKDLARRNDFSLQKSAADLIKAVQKKNETSTELAMEKSDLLSTVEALDAEWKKVKVSARDARAAAGYSSAAENSLSTAR
jgi:hypothetical protein